MSKKVYELTTEGLERLKDELQDLKDNKRPANLTLLREARAQGDLSENADYDAARNEQAKIETRISQIEEIVKFAKIIKTSTGDAVDIGKKVKIKYLADNREREFRLVGTLEANPGENKISVESVLGKSLLGKYIGDVATIRTPIHTEYDVEILEVSNEVA